MKGLFLVLLMGKVRIMKNECVGKHRAERAHTWLCLAAGAGIVLLTSLASHAGVYEGALRPSSTIIPTEDQDGFVLKRLSTSVCEAYHGDGTAYCGILSNGDQIRRPLFAFTLPDISAKKVVLAQLSLANTGVGADGSGADIYITSIADTDNPGTVDVDDFDEDALVVAQSAEELAIASTESLAAGARVAIDVTARVKEALGNARGVVTFRLRSAGEGVSNANAGRYFGNMKYANNEPKLIVYDGVRVYTVGLHEIEDGSRSDKRALKASSVGNVELYDSTTMMVGDHANGGSWRGLMRFDLPGIPVDEIVTDASITLYLSSIAGTPWSTMELVAYPSPQEAISAEDFDAASTPAAVIGDVFSPSSAGNSFATVTSDAFTAFVKGQIKMGKGHFGLRAQMKDGVWTNGDATTDHYLIGGFYHPTAADRPVLTVTTRPKERKGFSIVVR